jgi:redox-sensitive bicupin YhaK (pirin superfamily)
LGKYSLIFARNLILLCMENKQIRNVKALLYAQQFPMGKIHVRQPFPSHFIEYPDPFILLHHAVIDIHPDADLRNEGVGPHPHRGFSPVTFIFDGAVHHRDSLGNSSIIEKGGVQWINAGRGIMHSERPPENIHAIGSRQEIIQLWVNTPAKGKMKPAEYHPYAAHQIPQVQNDDGKCTIAVAAGEIMGTKGPIQQTFPLNAAFVYGNLGGKLTCEFPAVQNVVLYVLDGEIEIPGYGFVEKHNALLFDHSAEAIEVIFKKECNALLLAGQPLNEPIATHGPFVMNTQTEIMEAMRDFQMGKMGVLIE